MTDLPYTPPGCEHNYEDRKGPYPRLWVSVCQLCGDIDWADLEKRRQSHRGEGAESMRDRAAEIAADGEWSRLETPADRIRALPLLPDGEDTFDSPAAPDADTFEVTQGLEHHHLRTWTTPSANSYRITALEEGLRQAQAAIRGLESGRTAPRRPLTPDTDH